MTSLQDVTAVLITKHAEYPKEISLEGFGEVIIRTNSPSVYERYAAAKNAKNDIIYVQDDDLITNYKELFKHYNGQLTNAMRGRREFYEKISGGRITLVGFGAFFPKKMIDVFDQYEAKYGRDFHFYREADRIFTWLNYPHNTFTLPSVDIKPADGEPERMSADPRHFEYVDEVMKKLNTISPRRDFEHKIRKRLQKVRRMFQ